MPAIILQLGLSFSDVSRVENLGQWELTVPKPHDIVAAFQLYDLRATRLLQQAAGAKMLLALQAFCSGLRISRTGCLRARAR